MAPFLDSLWPWRAALAAGAAALAWGFGLRLARRPELAAAAAGVGLALGWFLALPLVTASPRQLIERLPLVVLAALAVTLAFDALAPRRLRPLAPALAVLAAAGCGWWMAGAPLTAADLRRAAPVALGVAAGAGVALWRLRDAWWAAAAGTALAGGLWAARAPAGPGLLLAAALVLAALGSVAARPGFGAASRVPLALALAALAAVPVLARGEVADWAAASAPVLALVVGPMLAPRLGRHFGPPLGWALAAAPSILGAAIASSRIP